MICIHLVNAAYIGKRVSFATLKPDGNEKALALKILEQTIEERVSDDVLRYQWNNCDAPVEWYLIEGGGHTWPGAVTMPRLGHTTTNISASELIWEFFFR